MPTYQFEAMDPQGQEIKDVIEATTQDEAQATIRSMGYFVTKISVQKQAKSSEKSSGKDRKTFALGGAGGKKMVTFTRQLSILQDAGLPILRSLKILEDQAQPGALKNGLIDVCDEIEGGASLSEAMSKVPKVFDRLYVNMIKAGEAGGSLEVILRRLAEFRERTQSLKNKIVGAMLYPVMVVLFTIGILTFIMLFIIPQFKDMFEEFGIELPLATQLLIEISNKVTQMWFLAPLIPITIVLFISITCKFKAGRMGWHLFLLKLPVLGKLVEKSNLARTTRTLGALISSGVPIIEGLSITRETAGNAMFEKVYSKVTDSVSGAWYLLNYKKPVVEDLVVNMVSVGEETGELDVMLYKVADYYEEEVEQLTEGMLKMIEPAMIIFLGLIVLFIVASLFMPLISIISGLTGS